MNEQTRIVNGHTITASIWPGVPSNATIVMLHGFPMDRHLWDAVGERLGSSHPVLAIDLPGFGGSSSYGSVLGMSETADWLDAALNGFEISSPIVLVGLSMGGYIALEFAARHGDRLERLILCSSRAEADGEVARKGRIAMAEAVDHIGVNAIAEEMLTKVLARTTWQRRPDVVDQLREMIVGIPPSAIAAAQRGMAARREMFDEIPRWDFRIDCIAGEKDSMTGPEVMQAIVDAARDAALHVIPDVGHVSPLENPEALSDCLRRIL